jgi:hypothetical protein
VTPRSLVRRPLQVGGLLLATAALGTAVAPAASAMVDPTAPVDHTPQQAPAAAARVLTNSPASFLGTPDEPVSFGVGKLQISVAPEPGVDAPESEDMSGAVVQVTFPDQELEDGTTPTATCTTDVAGTCVFPADSYGVDEKSGMLSVHPGERVDLEQVEAPSSGLFALPADEDSVVHGQGMFGLPVLVSDDVDRFAPTATPATPGSDGSSTGSVVFYDPLTAVSGGQPGVPVVPTAPAADTTAPAAPTTTAATETTAAADTTTAALVPVTVDAAAPPAAPAPALAVTGADVGPVAAVGGGLLIAGAAGLVLARRRVPR